jgi:hypothetical protein
MLSTVQVPGVPIQVSGVHIHVLGVPIQVPESPFRLLWMPIQVPGVPHSGPRGAHSPRNVPVQSWLPSEISVPKLLTALRGSTFILVLVSAPIFKCTHTVLIILPILAMIELGIELGEFGSYLGPSRLLCSSARTTF